MSAQIKNPSRPENRERGMDTNKNPARRTIILVQQAVSNRIMDCTESILM